MTSNTSLGRVALTESRTKNEALQQQTWENSRPTSTNRSLLFLVVLALVLLLHSKLSSAPDSLRISGTQTWTNSAQNWSWFSNQAQSTRWRDGAHVFVDQSSSTLSLNSVLPSISSIHSTQDLSIQSQIAENIQCIGSDSCTIEISSAKTLTLKSSLQSGLPISKIGAGTLQFASSNDSYLLSVDIRSGRLSFADNASLAAAQSLRSTPVHLAALCSLSYSGTANACDIHCGSLSGSGVVQSSGASANGLQLSVLHSASSSATLRGGNNGLTAKIVAGAVQELDGTTSGVAGPWTLFSHQSQSSLGAGVLSLGGSATIASSLVLRGAELHLDNSSQNLSSRLAASASASINFNGGTIHLRAASSGTTQNVGVAGTKALTLNAGAARVVVESQSGGSGRAQLAFGGANANFSLRDNTNMVIDFSGIGGSLGGSAASDPRVVFLGSGTPFLGLGGLLANTASTGTPGFATVNGNSFATWTANGVAAQNFTSMTTATELQSSTSSTVVDFIPTSNQTLSANVSAAALRISPNASTQLSCGTKSITCTALMLDGNSDFALTGSASIGSGTNSRYFYVCRGATALSLTQPLGASAAPINKAGAGTLILNGSSNQLAFSSANNLNILQGFVRASAASLGGATSSGGANCSINFRGGVLELDGGMNFARALDVTPTSSGGAVSFDAGNTNKGPGGFSAINGASSVTLVTSIGGSSVASLTWNDNAFLPSGCAFLLSSPKADSRITFLNPIALDNGSSTEYNAREFYVYDNTTSSSDCARLAGILSGGLATDLLKTGPGELELSAANTYAGATIVQQGTLHCVAKNTLPSTTTLHIMNATVRLDSSQHVRNVILDSGSVLDLGTNDLVVDGYITNLGGRIQGSGSIIINSTREVYFCANKLELGSLQLNSALGCALCSDLSVSNSLRLSKGQMYTDIHCLRVDSTCSIEYSIDSSSWINSVQAQVFDAQHSQHLFAIGDSVRAGMLRCTLFGLHTPGQLSVSSRQQFTQPHYLPSLLDSTKLLSRQWMLESDSLSADSMQLEIRINAVERDSSSTNAELVAAILCDSLWHVIEPRSSTDSSIILHSAFRTGLLVVAKKRCLNHYLHISSSSHGHTEPSGDIVLSCNQHQHVSIIPDPCSVVADVLVDGTSIGKPNSIDVDSLRADKTIYVLFQTDSLQVHASIQSEPADASICAGEEIKFRAVIDSTISGHYQWRINNEEIGEDSPEFILSAQNDADIVSLDFMPTTSCTTPSLVRSNDIRVNVWSSPQCGIKLDSASAPNWNQLFCPSSVLHVYSFDSSAQFLWSVGGNAHIVGSASQRDCSILADSVLSGAATITLQLHSSHGCSSQCQQVFVIGDTTAPSLQAPADCTISCADNADTSRCGSAQVHDNCSAISALALGHEDTRVDGVCAGEYMIRRTWIVADHNGNSASALQQIHVVDSTPLQIDSLAEVVVSEGSSIPLVDTSLVHATSACSLALHVEFMDESVSDSLCEGHYVLHRRFRVADACAQTASCVQRIVVRDSIAPSIECPSDISVSCSTQIPNAAQNMSEFIALGGLCSDNNSSNLHLDFVRVDTLSWLNSSHFHLKRLYRVTDACGNSSTAQHSILVHDEIAPSVANPDTLSWWQNLVLDHRADINYSDNCDGQLQIAYVVDDSNLVHTSATLAGRVFSARTHVVHWTVSDEASNTTSANQVLVVKAAGNASIHCVADSVVLFCDSSSCTTHITGDELDAQSDDDCPGLLIQNSVNGSSTLSGLELQRGEYHVHWTLRDSCGSQSECDQVIIVRDNRAPDLSAASCTVYLDSTGNHELHLSDFNYSVSDNCSATQVSMSRYQVHCTDLGQTYITMIARDADSNTRSINVQLTVRDTIKPLARAREIRGFYNSQGLILLRAEDCDSLSWDNCSIVTKKVQPDTIRYGADSVHYARFFVRDASDLESSCSVRFTVRDTSAPRIQVNTMCRAACTSSSCEANVDIVCSLHDNCDTHPILRAKTERGEHLNVTELGNDRYRLQLARGRYRIRLEALDESANRSTARMLVIVKDSTAPIVRTKKLDVFLDNHGHAHISAEQVDDGSTDNCGIRHLSLSKAWFDCADLGTHHVILRARDASQNEGSAVATVTVKDTIAPVVRTKNVTVNLTNGSAMIHASQINDCTRDNCALAGCSLSDSIFTCADVGNNVVKFCAWDASGNSASCTANVLVRQRPSAVINVTANSSVYTGGDSKHIYLGYGSQSCTLRAAASNGLSYHWSPSAHLSCTNCPNTVFSTQTEGLYSYQLIVTNACGCSDTAQVQICVTDVRVQSQPPKIRLCHNNSTLELNASSVASHLQQHSSDHLGSCASWTCASAREQIIQIPADSSLTNSNAGLSLIIHCVPQPFSDTFRCWCETPEQVDVSYQIFDLAGRAQTDIVRSTSHQVVELGAELSAGSYVVQVIIDNHRHEIPVLKY